MDIGEFQAKLLRGLERHLLMGHKVNSWGRHSSIGILIRYAAEPLMIEEDSRTYKFKAGKRITSDAKLASADWDVGWIRARRSSGWKEHKYSRQWEHRVREREKHQKNRDRKVNRREIW